MPKFKAMKDMAVAFPPTRSAGDAAVWHRAFCFWQQELNGNEFACWSIIRQYKGSPSKRRAAFIANNWLKSVGGSVPMTMDMSILAPINTGSVGGVLTTEQVGALRTQLAEIASVQHFSGKILHATKIASLGATPPDLFKGIEDTLEQNFMDILRRTPFDSEVNTQPSGFYATSLGRDLQQISAATFYPDLVGLW